MCAREVCCLVLDGKLQDLEDGELAELATIGVQGIQERLAAIQQSKRPLQTVGYTDRRCQPSVTICHVLGW